MTTGRGGQALASSAVSAIGLLQAISAEMMRRTRDLRGLTMVVMSGSDVVVDGPASAI